MQVRQMMSTQVVSIAPDENAVLAARLFRRYNVGVLPVCGADHKLQGMLTDRDLVLRSIRISIPQQTKVRDIMSNHVVAISPETESTRAAALMGMEQVRRLPVCEQGKLVGMISIYDLAQLGGMEASEALTEIFQGVKKPGLMPKNTRPDSYWFSSSRSRSRSYYCC